MDDNPTNPSRKDRKTVERNRRNQMKSLYSELNSLLPHEVSRELTSLPDQLDEVKNYIKKLQINVERLNDEKDRLLRSERKCSSSHRRAKMGSRSPQIEIHEVGSVLEVVIITGLDCQFMFSEAIRMLHEEGVDIMNASFSVAQDTVFHTIHAKIGESGSSCGNARIFERLKKIFQV